MKNNEMNGGEYRDEKTPKRCSLFIWSMESRCVPKKKGMLLPDNDQIYDQSMLVIFANVAMKPSILTNFSAVVNQSLQKVQDSYAFMMVVSIIKNMGGAAFFEV